MSDMHVCTMSCLKTTTNPSCVCAPLANKPDSDLKKIQVIRFYFGTIIANNIIKKSAEIEY